MCTWMEPEDEKDAKYNCDTQNGVLGFVTLANTKEAWVCWISFVVLATL